MKVSSRIHSPPRRPIVSHQDQSHASAGRLAGSVLEHEKAFQRIADSNDGNGASGTSGCDKSVDYIEWRMKKAGCKLTLQEFEFNKLSDLRGSELERISPAT